VFWNRERRRMWYWDGIWEVLRVEEDRPHKKSPEETKKI
jgi:hypothetical protein